MHTPSTRAQGARIEFYRNTGQIHPRTTHGRFNTWRWAMVWLTQLIFYGACWLQWDGRQALLFDIAERKFYLFGLVLWPQDALLLALLLIVAAAGLFLVTALAGRLFCGFACPQTVYTAIFRWVEAKVEGDHLARMRLDQAPPSARKLAIKGTKHAIWGAIALWTGISFVGYFTPIRELLFNLGPGELGPWEGFWVFFYAAFAYLQAGFAREMVCMHMCPYSRFQGVMFDADTRTISYDGRRGEPRRPRGTAAARMATAGAPAAVAAPALASRPTAGRGDCVDCSLCVQVCPTGIDIRDGLQYQCINCGLCADACDEVMERVGAPAGLIRFASERELAAPRATPTPTLFDGLRRPRAQVYLATLVVFSLLGAWMLAHRVPLQVDVLRDRHALLQEAADGSIENTYTLKLVNMLEEPRAFRIRVEGPAGARLTGNDTFQVASGSVLPVPLTVAARPEPGKSGAQPIRFDIEALDGPPTAVTEQSVFLLP
ncbi:cytochrome c oxidase accessory protein CcoG [Azoarcus olearius]|uniref:Iron-sulfur 4Fe-4S ferredoxin transmembrane protein n=1 Tax=Azoarcus sp. (strain BH72) TaxID=418699 RepID=A1K8D8_AZOSB|nr:cytochrome c oxidase accessory protein CcoG [Azoarcus olearius]CAL95093.1 putative iron-sulfur 4Fe-4S ferredoxin transmembrane protein [Azoarcus olearius]